MAAKIRCPLKGEKEGSKGKKAKRGRCEHTGPNQASSDQGKEVFKGGDRKQQRMSDLAANGADRPKSGVL